MNSTISVLLAAGGTGGHLFPAESLAHALIARGASVELVTDTRAAQYAANFPASAVHGVAAATPTGGSALSRVRAISMLGVGTLSAINLLRRLKPSIVVGFGGYPTVPPLMAASLLRIPTILHEQNAVMGRANRFLSGRVDHIATGFALRDASRSVQAKSTITGNPVRPSVIAASAVPYSVTGALNILVTGGSQGARVMADVVPAAIALLAEAERVRIKLVQQARGEDEARVEAAYSALNFSAEVAPFFADLPGRIAHAHLVIARSGASTVSELAAIGRPSILVPFPFALDQDQAANAAELARTGAAEVMRQAAFTPAWLASALRHALNDPTGLTRRAEAAKSAGILDAAERLADLVLAQAALAH